MHMLHLVLFFLFFFNDTATTEIYTLSLHDALPICADKVVAVAEYLQAGRLARLPRHGVRLAVQVVVGLERLPQRPPAWNPAVVSRDQTFQSGLGHDLCAGNAPILTAVPQVGGGHGVTDNLIFWRDRKS